MNSRILYTLGDGKFQETQWSVPDPGPTDITVQAVMTGVCRSDVDMMQGKFPCLPIHMSGHEGLAKVVDIGSQVSDVLIGEYVATRGEPAYSDYYNVRRGEYVPVPEAHPRYIIEPVACGVNCVTQALDQLNRRSGAGRRLLIIGSGFLAWVAFNTLRHLKLEYDITVRGNSNRDLWGKGLSAHDRGPYDVIIDLGSDDSVFAQNLAAPNALVILAAQKTVTTDFSQLLWNACTIIFPSPRTSTFTSAMHLAVQMISSGVLNVDNLWSRGYCRDTEWQQAFADAVQRPAGYNRGYIRWNA